MASRKRTHEEITPSPAVSSDIGSDHHIADTNNDRSHVSKKFKLAESISDPVVEVIDSALSRIIVEPCLAIDPTVCTSEHLFTPISGREAEFNLIEGHYKQCLTTQQPQPLFICGAPGCGKTASISKIMASSSVSSANNPQHSMFAPYTARVNCATDLVASKPSALYALLYSRLVDAFDASPIATDLGVRLEGIRPQDATDQELLPFLLKRINQHHIEYSKQTENKKPYFILVLIDEIDHILMSKNSLSAELHFLFSSWLESWGIISIVAISNAHDLFERNLPLLSQISASGTKTADKSGVLTIPFKPYSPDQLEGILRARIVENSPPTLKPAGQNLTLETIFDSKTLKFVCGKIAKLAGDQAGDVRILVDLCKSMLIQARINKKLPITLDVAAKTWKAKMGPSSADPISQLSRAQKCVLLCMLHASVKSELIRPSDLETTWKTRAGRIFPSTPDLSELWSSVSLLEGTGHVRIQKEKGNRVTYKLSSKDLTRESLSKDPLFNEFLP